MKVYLVVRIVERGFATDYEPVAVYQSKDDAKLVSDSIYGFVKELDFFKRKA